MLDVSELFRNALAETQTVETKGRVVEIIGTIIKAIVPEVKIGEICLLRDPGSGKEVQAEVVGFAKQMALLTPLGDIYGLSPHTEGLSPDEL
jgi:type III secretion protein N (ATPase)